MREVFTALYEREPDEDEIPCLWSDCCAAVEDDEEEMP
jgi:hypothetical protein